MITMASSDEPFPAADLEKELHPGNNKEFEVDSVSSAVDATNQIKVMASFKFLQLNF